MTNEHLWGKVFELCASQQTGAFVIEGAKSGQVVVANGRLVCVMYAGAIGQEAVNIINASELDSVTASAGLMFPAAAGLSEAKGEAILDGLNYTGYLDGSLVFGEAAVTDEPSKEPEYIEVTYRGQKIRKLKETNQDPVEGKKSVRIYRGQVVKD